MRVALRPEGRDINKVTVQLESRCIHSTAAYKADGDASDLKKKKRGGKEQSELIQEIHYDLLTNISPHYNHLTITALSHTYTHSFLD